MTHESWSLLPPTMAFPFNLLFTSFILVLSFSSNQSQELASTDPAYYYNLCSTSTCGNLSLPYPFAFPSFCGHPDIKVTCTNNVLLLSSRELPQAEPTRVVSNFSFDTAGISVSVAFNSLFGCGPVTRKNFIVGRGPFSLDNEYNYGTLLNCTQPPRSAAPGSLIPSSCLGCNGQKTGNNLCFYTPMITTYPECEHFVIFVKEKVNVSAIGNLREYLRRGQKIRYTKPASCLGCESTGGKCGSSSRGYFICYCASSVHRLNCSDGMVEDVRTLFPKNRKGKISKGVIAAISVSASVVALAVISITVAIGVVRCKGKAKNNGKIAARNEFGSPTHYKDVADGILPARYSYSQIKKFTSNFSTKVGEGGFGSVYKGFIQGSGHVAIKLLKRSHQSEKQFMNEVATLGRVHHYNLIRLLGYCSQVKKKALVYEFMENGSLDKYISDEKQKEQHVGKQSISALTSRQLYDIALEAANGILYLHEGCRSSILHLDIKPHNILLNSNFSARVADFGLAKIIDEDHRHVSITHAQGTPGYAAPEMWTKTYGPITDKSDVYSYGMLLLEMVGTRKKYLSGVVNIKGKHTFPAWVSKKAMRSQLKETIAIHEANLSKEEEEEKEQEEEEIEEGEEEEREEEGEEEGEDGDELLEKMYLTGVWCIQHIPSNRPSMNNVTQMLKGPVEIEIPPNPFPKGLNGENIFSHYYSGSIP